MSMSTKVTALPLSGIVPSLSDGEDSSRLSTGRLVTARNMSVGELLLVPDHHRNGKKINTISVGLGWDAMKGVDMDAYCLLWSKAAEPLETIYFENLECANGSIIHGGDNRTGDGDGDDEQIHLTLPHIDDNVYACMFVVNSYSGETFAEMLSMYIRLFTSPKFNVVLSDHEKSGDDGSDDGSSKSGSQRSGSQLDDIVEEEEEEEGEREKDRGDSDVKTSVTSTSAATSSKAGEDGTTEEGGSATSDASDAKSSSEGPHGGATAVANDEPPFDETIEFEIVRCVVDCEGDNTTMVVANMYRSDNLKGWYFRPSNTRATGDSIEAMLPQLQQSLRDFIPGIPELKDPSAPHAVPRALDTAGVVSHLYDVAATADGTGFVYSTFEVVRSAYTSAASLDSFKFLSRVIIRDSLLNDIDFLNSLDFVLYVDCSGNNIESWSGVRERKYLEEVSLKRNYIKEHTPVVHPSLRRISYARCRLKSMVNFDKGSALKVVDLSYNNVPSLRRVVAPFIEELYMASNSVRLIGRGMSMPALKRLHLRDNKLQHLKGFEGLGSLTYLNLRDNPIGAGVQGDAIEAMDEIKVLVPLTALTSLNILQTPIADFVTNYRAEVLAILPSLTFLDKLEISMTDIRDAEEIKAEYATLEEDGEGAEDKDDPMSDVGTSISDMS